jgi:hypothetical protein
MKRSILAIVVAIFFGVAGMVVLQHSEYSRVIAEDGNNSANTVFDINCVAQSGFAASDNVAITVSWAYDGSGNAPYVTPSIAVSSTGNPAAEDGVWETSEKNIEMGEDGNDFVDIYIKNPTMVGVARCLGGFQNAGVSYLKATADFTAPAMNGGYHAGSDTLSADNSSYTNLADTVKSSAIISLEDSSFQADDSTIIYGKDEQVTSNNVNLHFKVDTSKDAANSSTVYIDYQQFIGGGS